MEPIKFKDEATQAADIIFGKFKDLIHCQHATLRWADKECGTAVVNDGLVTIQFADMLTAVRQGIPLEEIQEWEKYNSRLEYVGLKEYAVPLENWTDYKTAKLSNFELEIIEKTYGEQLAATIEYEQAIADAKNKISKQTIMSNQ